MSTFISSVAVNPPAKEVLSLGAAKRFLGNPTGQDLLISALIVAARQAAEKYTWRSLCKKTYLQTHDGFPRPWRGNGSQIIKLWHPPLISIDTITYVGTDGEDHSLTPGTDFQVDVVTEPGRISPLPGACWPQTMCGVLNAVRIAYTAGYEVSSDLRPEGEGDDNSFFEPEQMQVAGTPPTPTQQVTSYTVDRTIPTNLATAVKMTVVHWFQNRDPVIAQPGAGGSFSSLPFHVEQILNSFSCKDLALAE